MAKRTHINCMWNYSQDDKYMRIIYKYIIMMTDERVYSSFDIYQFMRTYSIARKKSII